MPKLDDAFGLASKIGVSLEYLLTGKGQKTYSPRVSRIAEACEAASDLELSMVEKILDIPIAGKNTDVQMTS